jgi:DNA modification methylase
MIASANLDSRISQIDWDFTGNSSESPFSALHWHPGRFASQIPASLIGMLSSPGDTLLDPFVGSGTTLVEAQRLGRRSIGIDLNPVSCLATSAKVIPRESAYISALLDAISSDVAEFVSLGLVPPSVPASVQAEKWYTSRVKNGLGRLWSLLSTYSGDRYLLACAAFSGILLSACRETRHWGYVCDNSTPRSARESDPLLLFNQALERLRSSYSQRDQELTKRGAPIYEGRVVCADSREALLTLDYESVDLVVTSPPYFGVCDYIKAQRLSMEWLGLEIEPLRLREVGARSKRRRLGSDQHYICDLANNFAGIARVLRPGGMMAALIGESQSRVGVLERVARTLQEAGFEIVSLVERQISRQRRQHPSVTKEKLIVAKRLKTKASFHGS